MANKHKLPYPILLVIASLIIGFIHSLPNLALDPEVVFVILLPSLLCDAMFIKYQKAWILFSPCLLENRFNLRGYIYNKF